MSNITNNPTDEPVVNPLNMNSILISIRKLLGPSQEYTYFDPDIIIHINSALMVLTQLGVGPAEGFYVVDEADTWDEFIPDGQNLNAVKTYVYQKVKLLFDPPASTAAMDAIERSIKEFEWRLNIAAESAPKTDIY